MVALCTESAAFSENQVLRREIAGKYPGALWVPELADKLLQRDIFMVTGDVALRQVRAGEVRPTEIWVIEEDRSSEAEELIRLGATAKVLLCFESPLFAANFYQELPKLSRQFDHCIIFDGAIINSFPRVASHKLFFPSFDSNIQFKNKQNWRKRKYLVMVAGNKYWIIIRHPIRQILANIRDFLFKIPKRFSESMGSVQLHDKRLAAIAYFGKKGKLDLFGSGWQSLINLPSQWQNELSDVIQKLKPSLCTDKHETIAQYKYALCFENIEFSGYITEKIFDCLAAGVVPIYWGAPDINKFVPNECFINAHKFNSFQELDLYLEQMSEEMWLKMLNHGYIFMKGHLGQQYTYNAFAQRIEKMLFV